MGKKKSTPVPVTTPSWYFRDRKGHKIGPYTDIAVILDFLKKHLVSHNFRQVPPKNWWDWQENTHPEFVMEDADWNPVNVSKWVKDARRNDPFYQSNAAWREQYRSHVYRRGPVRNIGNGRRIGTLKKLSQARLLRDTVRFCAEDMEPPIRVKRRFTLAVWADECYRGMEKNWKSQRKHQWHG